MSDYVKTTNFAAKDALISGDPAKKISGVEVDAEFDAIETASATKADAANPELTGNGTAVNLSVSGTLNSTGVFQIGGVAITATAAELNTLDGITATVTELNYTDGVTSNIQTQIDSKATLNSDVTFSGLHIDSTGAVEMPTGTEAQRPTPVAGMFRFNEDESTFEGYDGTEWGSIAGGGAVGFTIALQNLIG